MASCLSQAGVSYNEAHCVLVAAIDFGTSFSGYAFSFKSSPDSIMMNKNWGEPMGFKSYKAPTCVLTGPDHNFLSFGYEAEKEYTDIEADDERSPRTKHLYRHFKMVLYDKKKVTRETMIKSTAGYSRRAMDIFIMALRYLKDHLIDTIKNQPYQPFNTGLETKYKYSTTGLDASMIKWVITVPAIWNDEAKQFMREAAFKADLISTQDSRQLLIALEPEAASIYCRSLDIDQFANGEDENMSAKFPVGTVYMVIDAGGGTVDITVHEVLPNDQVKEIHTATGGNWGGNKVDGHFNLLLGNLQGGKFLNVYKRECPQDWLTLMIQFEKVKKSAKPESNKIVLPLSWSMGNKFKDVMGYDIEDSVKKASSEGVTFSNGSYVLNNDAVINLFKPVVTEIVAHIENLLDLSNARNCQYFLLVGGFGESAFLQDAIKKKFDKKLLVPNEAQMSVMKGAVLFGHRPMAIKSRISKKTYGVEICRNFDEKIHDRQYLIMCDGYPKCDHLFDPFAQKGEEIDTGTKRAVEYYPTSKEQTSMRIGLYTTNKIIAKKSATYTTQSDMEKVGEFLVDMPDTHGGRSRKVKLDIEFGGTEIHIKGTDLTTGNAADTSIDFLTE